MSDTSPAPRGLLASNEVASREALHRRKDADAAREQASLFRVLSSINWLVLLLAVLSGVILAKGALVALAGERGPLVERGVQLLALAVAGIAVATTALGQFARDGDRLGRWRKLRAEAELARGQRFVALARVAANQGPEAALAALGAVRRDLLLHQRDWYLSRAARHRESARVTGWWNAAAVVLAAASSAAAVAVLVQNSAEWLLLVGVLAAALGSFATDRESLYRDRANAELYELTAEKLTALDAGVDAVADAVAGGNPQAVVAFAEMVAEELAAEHRQWASGLDATAELLARLEQRVAQARAARAAGAAGAVQTARDAAAEVREKGVGGLAREGAEAVADAVRERGAGAVLAAGSAVLAGGGAGGALAAATGALAGPEAKERLERWQRTLAAASHALPPPWGDRAAELAGRAGEAAASGSSGGVSASDLLGQLRGDNPAARWLASAAPKIAGAVGSALPPLALVVGVAAVGAKLGEVAYRRWMARVLELPFAARQLEIAPENPTTLLAALDAAPLFRAALANEVAAGDLGALGEAGAALAGTADEAFAKLGARFEGRAAFDAAFAEVQRALLGRAGDDDLAALPPPPPGAVSAAEVLEAAQRLREAGPEAGDALQSAVRLAHELRGAGVDDPAASIAAVAEGRDP